MNKENYAFYHYDNMVINYQKYLRGGVGSKAAYGKFINAAIALAQLKMPNPFTYDHSEPNAAKTPVEGNKVTAVAE